MATVKAKSCSPYLRRSRRSLRDACHEAARDRGAGAPPCHICALADPCTDTADLRRLLPGAVPLGYARVAGDRPAVVRLVRPGRLRLPGPLANASAA